MAHEIARAPIDVLMVEDNADDIELTVQALKDSKMYCNLHTVEDGEEALAYLYKKDQYCNAVTPDLILLDLNLPKIDGKEVLQTIKADENLKHIPVIILTTSSSHDDIIKTYQLYANCYITKPVDFKQFIKVVESIENFWFTIVKLPK